MIQTQVILTPDDKLEIRNWKTVLFQMKAEGITLFDVTIKRPFSAKTSDQVAYLMAEVLVKAMHGFRNMGVPCRTKEMAYDKLCLVEDIDFTDRVQMHDGHVYPIPKRLSLASMNEVYQFIHLSIIFIESELQMEVNPPEEFLKFYEKKIFREKITENGKTKK